MSCPSVPLLLSCRCSCCYCYCRYHDDEDCYRQLEDNSDKQDRVPVGPRLTHGKNSLMTYAASTVGGGGSEFQVHAGLLGFAASVSIFSPEGERRAASGASVEELKITGARSIKNWIEHSSVL